MGKRVTDDDRIAHAEHLIGELREVTTEAHKAIKDLNKVIGDAQAMETAIHVAGRQAFDEMGQATVEEWLSAYVKAIEQAIEEATNAVYDRFDLLSKTMLGETREAKRKHAGISLVEAAELIGRERVDSE